MLTVSALQAGTGCTQEIAGQWLSPISFACGRLAFNTPQRIAAYLAQTGVESSSLTALTENLNYSASRLAVVWPTRFAVDVTCKIKQPNSLALSIAGNPEKIANQVYANRLGNGGPESGDGWRYRGRGLIQLTGKDLYILCGKGLGLDLINDPDLLLIPTNAAMSAAWYMYNRGGLWAAIDSGNIDAVTKLVNGAPASEVNHGPLRASRYQAALQLLQS